MFYVFSQTSVALELFYSEEDNGFTYLTANGPLVTNDAARIKALLRKSRKSNRATAILLTSPGGFLEVTPAIAQAIVDESNHLQRLTSRHNLLVINEECSSACTALMAAITKRHNPQSLKIWVTPDARFGFHSPVEPHDGKMSEIRDENERTSRTKKQLDYYTDFGVSAQWLSTYKSVFMHSEITEFSALKLCSEQSRIIPPSSCLDDNNDVIPKIEQELSKTYLAPKKRDRSRKKL